MIVRVLSFDPGSANFAWAASEHRIEPVFQMQQGRVLACGHLKNTLRTLKNSNTLRHEIEAFEEEVTGLFTEYGPFDLVIAERYMSQGRMVGATAEVVNLMLGLLGKLTMTHGYPFPELIAAATWKNEYNRRVAAYSHLREDYSLCGTSAHQLDAALIGFYGAHRLLLTRPFQIFEDELWRDRYFQWVERGSLDRLTKRRRTRNFYRTVADE